VIEKGRYRGYVINWLGRHCHISNKEWAYILPNHLIQGGGADVIKVAMVQVYKLLRGTKSRMVLQVHDSLDIEMHPDDFEHIPTIQKIMESVYPSFNGMKLTVSIEHSWKSLAKADAVGGIPVAQIQRRECIQEMGSDGASQASQ
jgi:DNA polymerase I-like protein with 3'-5' exonuclease and polymerase domains